MDVQEDNSTKIIEDVIWFDPDRVSGAPCFINTRVPIQTLFDYLEGGEPLSEFLDGFPPVTREQAVKVLKLAKNSLLNANTFAKLGGGGNGALLMNAT